MFKGERLSLLSRRCTRSSVFLSLCGHQTEGTLSGSHCTSTTTNTLTPRCSWQTATRISAGKGSDIWGLSVVGGQVMFYADLADTVVPFSRLQNQRRPRDRHLLPLACAIPWSHIATSPTDPFWAHPSFSRRMCARAVHACSLRIAIALAPSFATTDGQDQSEFVYGRVPAPSRQPHAIKACSLFV